MDSLMERFLKKIGVENIQRFDGCYFSELVSEKKVKKKQSLSDKVTIMKNQVRDFLLDHPKTNFVTKPVAQKLN